MSARTFHTTRVCLLEYAPLEFCFSVFTSIFTCIYSYFSFLFLPYLHQKNFFEIRARGGQDEFPPLPPSFSVFAWLFYIFILIYSSPFASFFPYFLQKMYPKP